MQKQRYLRVRPNDPMPTVDRFAPFKALVIIDEPVSAEWRRIVSEWLVGSGCLCMMAWGDDCSLWDDSVDAANLAAFDHGNIPDDQFVVTSWHESDSLPDVMFFAKFTAFHLTKEITNLLFLHIGPKGRGAEFNRLYLEAE